MTQHDNSETTQTMGGVPILYLDMGKLSFIQTAGTEFLGEEINDNLSILMQAVLTAGMRVEGIAKSQGIRERSTIRIGDDYRSPNTVTLPSGTKLTSDPYDILLYRPIGNGLSVITHSLAWVHLIYHRKFIAPAEMAIVERLFTGLDENYIEKII
jgi:hypothetical protein